MANWKPIDDYTLLPVGTWLIKCKAEIDPYHVATVTLNTHGKTMVIVGQYFYWDMEQILAYTSFEGVYTDD